MLKWKTHEFESGSYTSPDFKEWFKDLKKYIKKQMGNDYTLVNFSSGHFFASGFIKNKSTDKLAYISFSDVRHFSNEWYDSVLIRTAEHSKDYTGGRNQYTPLTKLIQNVDVLTRA